MKKYLALLTVVIALGIAGCGPYPTEQAVEVKNNETAFVVPLEGDTKANQAQFMSVEYLEKAKVASKRIILPLRKRSTGRAWFSYEWVPLARVIIVDRSPQTREWLGKEGIKVESQDSVGFTVGINATAMIKEEDAAKFLYYYPGGSLSTVMDKNIRGYVQNVLSKEFGSQALNESLKSKKEIIERLTVEITKHFEKFGVTIASIGIADGLTFDNSEVQKTIDSVFVNATVVLQATQQKEAQVIKNQTELSVAETERKKAEEFAKAAEAQTKMINLKIAEMEAQAKLEAAKRWNGQAPSGVVPSSSPFLFNFSEPTHKPINK